MVSLWLHFLERTHMPHYSNLLDAPLDIGALCHYAVDFRLRRKPIWLLFTARLRSADLVKVLFSGRLNGCRLVRLTDAFCSTGTEHEPRDSVSGRLCFRPIPTTNMALILKSHTMHLIEAPWYENTARNCAPHYGMHSIESVE